jgi:tetratricopeptide (TPR) repeat protein
VSFADNANLQRAMTALQAGNFKGAERLFKDVLRTQPKHIAALNLLGVVLTQLGKFAEAETYLRLALREYPKSDATLYNYGIVLKALNRPTEALDRFTQALEINPRAFETWNNRGTVFNDLKRYDEAIADFNKANDLKLNYAEAFHNKGKSLSALRRSAEALAAFDAAVTLKPDLIEAWLGRAHEHFKLNHFEQAIDGYSKVLGFEANSTTALLGRGNSLFMLKRYEEALADLRRACTLDAGVAEIWLGLGNVFCDLRRYNDALETCEKALSLKPDLADAWLCRGNTLCESGRHIDAISAYDHALTLEPALVSAWLGRGRALFSLNRHSDSLLSLDKAIELDPEFAEPRYNKSLVALSLGDYESGWALYEWRWKVRTFPSPQRHFKQPLWLGDREMRNQTILVHSEQGFGDAIQFYRYMSLLRNEGCTIVAEVQRDLAPLLQAGHDDVRVISRGDMLPHFDVHCPFMSLPLAFQTTLRSIPQRGPYVFADNQKLIKWRQNLKKDGRPKIGVAWSGNSYPDPNRSIPAGELSTIWDAQAEWHSLQKEIRPSDLSSLPHVHNHSAALHDFSDTAALIFAMDLIITIDTAVAHLAGALGKPVWILLPYHADFRWLRDEETSPWYPTARLFRQRTAGDWSEPLRQVADKLKTLTQ